MNIKCSIGKKASSEGLLQTRQKKNPGDYFTFNLGTTTQIEKHELSETNLSI